MIIKILGSGCSNCHRLEANAKEAVKALGLEAKFVKVTDIMAISAYNIMRTPGLVVDEKVVSYGRVPSPQEIKSLLTK